jgi:phage terminase large subunit GpA-like protein
MYHLSQLQFEETPGGPSAWAPDSILPELLARIFAQPPTDNVWQWAQKNVVLDAIASPTNPGPYDSRIAPHTRFLQECFTNPAVRQITIKKNSQGGFTEGVLNCIRFCVAHQPRNVLYAIDSAAEARRLARIRLKPSLERCPLTAQAIPEDEDDYTALNLYLRDMFIMFIGGGSIGAAANKVISFGIVDEADKIPRVTKGHKHLVDEMKSRFKTVPDMKLIILSEPNEEHDITTTEFRRGSQHRYHVPCPHCGLFQVMVQERLIFDHCKLPSGEYDQARVLAEAHYQCLQAGTPACPDGRIHDRHKRDMSLRSEWRAMNLNPEPGHISLESSDLFSLFPDATFGRIALDLIDAIKKPARRKAVQSGRFGLEHKTRRVEVRQEDLLKLCGDYHRGTMPVPCLYLGLCSDVQEGVKKWVKAGFDRLGDLYVVDWGDCLSFDDLTTEADVPVLDGKNEEWRVISGLIDEGYKTEEVRKFCIRTNFRFLPAKGRGNLQSRGALVAESLTVHDGTSFQCYHFNDDKFKQSLYVDRIRDFERIKKGLSRIPRIWFPKDVGLEFLDELMGEELVPEQNVHGYPRLIWKKTRTNDWGDALKLLVVQAHVVINDLLVEQEQAEAAAAAAKAKAEAAAPS